MDCDCFTTPFGMSRRHFMRHMAGAAALVAPAFALTRTLRANSKSLSKNHKSAILLWLGGGPPSIDMWDMKPGAPTAGQFKPISTTGDFQICELMPSLAKQGKNLAVVRSMSTREADHNRGRYYMHTAMCRIRMLNIRATDRWSLTRWKRVCRSCRFRHS